MMGAPDFPLLLADSMISGLCAAFAGHMETTGTLAELGLTNSRSGGSAVRPVWWAKVSTYAPE